MVEPLSFADLPAPNGKVIYLTFDCGYEYTATDDNGQQYRVTERILDVLKEKNVKAVFFVTMYYCKMNPDLVQRMIDEGHAVGNHTNNHPVMPAQTIDKMVYEVTSLETYVKENFGGYQMTLATNGAQDIYFCNQGDVQRVPFGVDKLFAVGVETLGLGAPAGELCTYTKAIPGTAGDRTVVQDGKCVGYPMTTSPFVNYILDGGVPKAGPDQFLAIGHWGYEAMQIHGPVMFNVDAQSAEVFSRRTVVVSLALDMSMTELSSKVNGNTSNKPQAFKLIKLVEAEPTTA